MIVIAGSNSLKLAKEIANEISVSCIVPEVKYFEDKELSIKIDAALNKKKVIIVQSTSKPANDHLMELLLLVDAAKRAGARKIIAVIPYFGYARQDRISQINSPISASLVAALLEAAGVKQIITLDLHSKQIEGFFNISVQNIEPIKLFLPYIESNQEIIVSPDLGGALRAQKFSNLLSCDLAVINKTRDSENKCIMHGIMGDVKNKHCILIDDIIDTGNTIYKAAELLKQEGALSIKAFITHAVLSNKAQALLEKSYIDKIFITNSITQENLGHKFKILSITKIISDSLI